MVLVPSDVQYYGRMSDPALSNEQMSASCNEHLAEFDKRIGEFNVALSEFCSMYQDTMGLMERGQQLRFQLERVLAFKPIQQEAACLLGEIRMREPNPVVATTSVANDLQQIRAALGEPVELIRGVPVDEAPEQNSDQGVQEEEKIEYTLVGTDPVDVDPFDDLIKGCQEALQDVMIPKEMLEDENQ